MATALVGCSKSLVPAERTAIFPKEAAPQLLELCWNPPSGVTAFWTPSENDLAGVEDRLGQYIASEQAKLETNYSPDWRNYYRQVGGIVWRGEKMLFISYAWAQWMKDPQMEAERKRELEMRGRPYDPNWWKTKPISVQDGGAMFFRVIYSPNRGQFVWYDQNVR